NPAVNLSKTIHAQMDLPPAIAATLERSCFDCHSNETKWPWYSRIPFAGEMMRRDVLKARASMNFSEWADQAGKTPRRAAGTLMAGCADMKSGRMPKTQYLLMHPNSRLKPTEIAQFCEWTESLSKSSNTP